jgi:ribokinase
MAEPSLIVIGALNTDIIGAGLASFPKPNDPVYGGKFKIGPGGKPGNIASMAGRLSEPGAVAVIAKTVEDANGLWKYPVDGLRAAGVNIDHVTVLKPDQTDQQPSVALVAVNKQGDNMCFILPGVSQEFSEADIDQAVPLFETAAANNGIFALVLECPLPTALHATRKASGLGLRVIIDPGGVVKGMDITELIATNPFLIKPNEHEARIITGITIADFDSARQAAAKLRQLGAQNVLVTHGEHGAYLFAGDSELQIPVPEVPASDISDSIGCGDQAMAALCVALQAGKSLEEAAKFAVLAGTLQFGKQGCQPITPEEIEARL